MKTIKSRITDHIKKKQKEYQGKKFSQDKVNFEDSSPVFESIFITENSIIYADEKRTRKFLKITLVFDG